MHRVSLRRRQLAVVTALSFAVPAVGQGWRAEQVREVALEFDAPGGLERIPMRLGSESPFLRARLQPREGYLVDDRMSWVCEVLEFDGPQPAAAGGAGAGGGGGEEGEEPDPKEEARRRLVEAFGAALAMQPQSFRQWIEPQGAFGAPGRTLVIDVEGELKTGRGRKLDYRHWVWRHVAPGGKSADLYGEAAVYEIDGHEVVLAVRMPLEDARSSRPSPKWRSVIGKIVKSGRAFEDDEGDGDDEDDRHDAFADTPEKQRALAAAKDNIRGLRGWDYFTTEHYIVLYSWDHTGAAKGVSRKQAKFYSSRLERMRELYTEHYPLDETGVRAVMPDPATIPDVKPPVTGEGSSEGAPAGRPIAAAANPGTPSVYPVFRLCATYDQFRKYGQSPPGVVGWFSPLSKELVVFLGGDEMMGKGATEDVTYHEGWHQYADLYFGSPERPQHDQLHRWFDEGHGDFFGSHQLRSGRWNYEGSPMRHDTVLKLVDRGKWVAFKDLTRWPRQKFYGRDAALYYAQAWSMIDFLRRGSRLRSVWKDRYETILDDYKNVMLVHGDSARATATAFRGFTDADWTELEQAWCEWVQSRHFRGGR